MIIYYDGQCPVCYREMEHYKKRMNGNSSIQFINFEDPQFNAEKHGLELLKLRKALHIRMDSGEVKKGPAAFLEIWKQIPGYQRLSKVAAVPPIFVLFQVAYFFFAKIRRWIPGRIPLQHCSDGTCKNPMVK